MPPETDDEFIIPLVEEQLNVDRRTVTTGVVSVSTVTSEYQQPVDELLVREQIEVSRIPVAKFVDSMPEVREESDVIIVPVIEEVMVRRLFLKEELHIRKVRTTEHHRELVTLRRQEAVVTRRSDGSSGPAAKQNASKVPTPETKD